MSRPKINHRRLYKSAITGRYRKLGDGAMLAIRRAYADGAKVADLCNMYGVSPGVVYSICYWTVHGGGQRQEGLTPHLRLVGHEDQA